MNLVIQIRTTGIQFCTSVKEFSIYIIQIKMPVESIQIYSNLRGKRIFEHSYSHVGNRIRNMFIQIRICMLPMCILTNVF